jgi:hypothetical protein
MAFEEWQSQNMIDDTKQSPEPQKNIRILDLIPDKTPVQTSLGPLYVRHIYTSDWKHLESKDLAEVGKIIVCRLVSRFEDKSNDTPLSEDDMEAIVDADLDALAPTIVKQCGWGMRRQVCGGQSGPSACLRPSF